MNKLLPLIYNITKYKYTIVRLAAGLFALYFFVFYSYSIDEIVAFKGSSPSSAIEKIFFSENLEHFQFYLKLLIFVFILASIFFTIGFYTRMSALFCWAGITLAYNFCFCINQPHLTYLIYIFMSYVLLSREFFFSCDGEKNFDAPKMLSILTAIYMYQMSLSGLSKALSPEWRSGEILKIMSEVYDPEPGIYLVGYLPNYLLKIATWFVLLLESLSFVYIIWPFCRRFIWLAHICLYFAIILLIPHAKHVAMTMIIFNIFILDKNIFTKKSAFQNPQ